MLQLSTIINICSMCFPCIFSDIDECSIDNGNCEPPTFCVNTPGTYSCICPLGFASADGTCVGKYKLYTLHKLSTQKPIVIDIPIL